MTPLAISENLVSESKDAKKKKIDTTAKVVMTPMYTHFQYGWQ